MVLSEILKTCLSPFPRDYWGLTVLSLYSLLILEGGREIFYTVARTYEFYV